MSLELAFGLANLLALAGWLALLLAPLRRPLAVLTARVIVALLCGAYVVTVISSFGQPGGEGIDFSTLAGVQALFTMPIAVLAGWIHYLAFDLFVGAFIVEDAPRARIPQWAVIPILVVTFLAGPAGLLSYLLIRAIVARRPA